MTLPNRTIEVITGELHTALKRETADILTIGGLLAEAKKQIPHGEWLPWLKSEVSMSERSAQKSMKAADFAAKYELGADLDLSPSALFLLLAELDVTNEAKSEEGATGSVQQHARPRRGVNSRDDLVFNFTQVVLELHRLTKNNQPERFAKSSVAAEILARLGQILTDIVNIKKSEVDKSTFNVDPVRAWEKLS
jgi:hypothetical protein